MPHDLPWNVQQTPQLSGLQISLTSHVTSMWVLPARVRPLMTSFLRDPPSCELRVWWGREPTISPLRTQTPRLPCACNYLLDSEHQHLEKIIFVFSFVFSRSYLIGQNQFILSFPISKPKKSLLEFWILGKRSSRTKNNNAQSDKTIS